MAPKTRLVSRKEKTNKGRGKSEEEKEQWKAKALADFEKRRKAWKAEQAKAKREAKAGSKGDHDQYHQCSQKSIHFPAENQPGAGTENADN